MSSYKLVALDLDGTLVDSAPDLAHCLGDALESVGLKRPLLAEAKSWIGDGVEILVRRGLTAALGRPPEDDLTRTALSVFRERYRDRLFVSSTLYDGVEETLRALADSDFVVGCATNKPEAFAIDLLDQAGIGSFFDFVHGGDSFAKKKPDAEPLSQAASRFGIAPNQGVMVGDSHNDLASAEAAGFDFIFVSYGYAPADDPLLSGLATVIDQFSALKSLLCD